MPGPSLEHLSEICKARIAALPAEASPIEVACEIMDEVYKALSILLVLPLSKRLPKRRLRRVRVFVRITHMLCWRCAETSDWLPLYCGHAWRRRATHAWVEIYHEGRWVGLDPTHNRLIDDNYITIAHGRDYRDCMLDIGIFSGADVTQTQWVNVSVHEQGI